MKKSSGTMNRANLLLAGGATALGTLLIGAVKKHKVAPDNDTSCCGPIDLSYTDGTNVSTSGERTRKKKRKFTAASFLNITGVYLLSPTPSQPSHPDIPNWTYAGTIPNALISGTDEDKNKHGGEAHGNSGKGNKTAGPVWVYVQ